MTKEELFGRTLVELGLLVANLALTVRASEDVVTEDQRQSVRTGLLNIEDRARFFARAVVKSLESEE